VRIGVHVNIAVNGAGYFAMKLAYGCGPPFDLEEKRDFPPVKLLGLMSFERSPYRNGGSLFCRIGRVSRRSV
jgi:hypothetical protein